MRLEHNVRDRVEVFCYGGQGSPITKNCAKAIRGPSGAEAWRRVKEAFNVNVPDNPKSFALREWVEHECENYISPWGSTSFDPYMFDRFGVNQLLFRVRKREER